MKRVKSPFRQQEFRLFLFFLMFALSNWPLVAVPAKYGLMAIFSYFYLLWGIVIILMMLTHRSMGCETSGGSENQEGDDGNA